MFATIYHGYIGFAMTLFTVVGALSVCVIACIILANTLQELLIKFKDNWDEEHDRARWVKDDKK